MNLLILRTNDPLLADPIQSTVEEALPNLLFLVSGSSQQTFDLVQTLGGNVLVLFDRRLPAEALPPSVQAIDLLQAPAPPPYDRPALQLPPRPPEWSSLLRVLFEASGPDNMASQSQGRKCEAIARFQSGLAHDLNNRLTTLLGNLMLLEEILPAEERPLLDDMRLAAQSAEHLLAQLQAFSHRSPLPPHPFNLSRLLRDWQTSLARLCGPSCPFSLTLPDQDVLLHADEAAVEQILLNFAASAAPDCRSLHLALRVGPNGPVLHFSSPTSSLPSLDETLLPGLATTRQLLAQASITLHTETHFWELQFPAQGSPHP